MFALILLLSLFKAPVFAPAYAVEEPVGASISEIEQIEQQILTDKEKRVPGLFDAESLLNSGKYDLAIKKLHTLSSNRDFADFYNYLMGMAHYKKMLAAVHAGHWVQAIGLGETASIHFNSATTALPYNTLDTRITLYLGLTEVHLGGSYAKVKKKDSQHIALSNFESGFQRLSQSGFLAAVPKPFMIDYARLCERSPNEVCTSWEAKLAPLLKKSIEAKVFERVATYKPPAIERTTTVPYKVDLDLQMFQKGFTFYLAGKYDDAYATWRNLLKDYPRTSIKLRTKFWMGRAAQKSNHDAYAETLYKEVIKELPFAYYALLASWFGNIDLSRMMDVDLPAVNKNAPILTPSDVVHLRRAEQLLATGVTDLASIELSQVHAKDTMPNEFLVYLALLNHLAQNHLSSFQIFGELSSRNFQGLFSSYGQRLLFPTTYLPLIRKRATEAGMDPLVVISVIKQESAFEKEITSRSNAFGLMQLILPTARDMDPEIEMIDLFDPDRNVRLGSRYLRVLLNKYGGNIIPTLAAYNAGPANADRWIREAPPELPPEEFIETINFRETREYVENILRNYYWYNRRIKGESYPHLAALLSSIAGPGGIKKPAIRRENSAQVSGASKKRRYPAGRVGRFIKKFRFKR